jgi:hypothetical protein
VVLFTAARAFVAIVPDWTPPDVFSGLGGYATTLGEQAAGFSNWVPISLAATVVFSVATLFATINGVKLLLWLWDKVPVVGG